MRTAGGAVTLSRSHPSFMSSAAFPMMHLGCTLRCNGVAGRVRFALTLNNLLLSKSISNILGFWVMM